MKKDISFSIKYPGLLRIGLLFVIFYIQFNWASSQTVGGSTLCNCDKMIVKQPNYKKEKESVFEAGENITNKLEAAILENCRVIIKNTNSISPKPGQAGNITLYVSPLTFSNIQNKEIVLEQGVTLQGITGGYSDCSQSVFTFEGAKVQNILILGEYDICQVAENYYDRCPLLYV